MSEKKNRETSMENLKEEERVVVLNAENSIGDASSIFPGSEPDGSDDDGSYTISYQENEKDYPDDNVKDTTEVGEYNPDAIQVL